MAPGTGRFSFGDFELDTVAGRLTRAGESVHLPPQAFRILALLVAGAGRLVTRDELARHLWAGDTHVDFAAGIAFSLKQLRDALGDSAQSPAFIETVPRRGYRFIAPVHESAQDVVPPVPHMLRRPSWARAGAVLALALVVSSDALQPGVPAREMTPARMHAAELLERARPRLAEVEADALRERIGWLDQAVELDPGRAEAHAALAEAWVELGALRGVPPSFAYARARAIARHALDLDPASARATGVLGRVALIHDWNWPEAGRLLRTAVRLSPADADLRSWYSEFLSASGRHREAVVEARRAVDLAPTSLAAGIRLGRAYLGSGDANRARQVCSRALESAPGSRPLRDCVFTADLQVGQPHRAVAAIAAALTISGRPEEAAAMREVFAREGVTGLCRWRVAELERAYAGPRLLDEAMEIALLLSHANDRAAALQWLRRAADAHLDAFIWIRTAPALHPLRHDPEFAAIERRVDPGLFIGD
jgi:DNA-binding winged helix-turn-helix (wHTH) protein/tetratricopeptide (TPR) repeat protein